MFCPLFEFSYTFGHLISILEHSHIFGYLESMSNHFIVHDFKQRAWLKEYYECNFILRTEMMPMEYSFCWRKIDLQYVQVSLDMTDHCMTDFCLWRTICSVPVPCISSMCHMYMTYFAYDGPIFLVPLSLSYPSSPVLEFSSVAIFPM